jgi:uncharacterized protein
MNETDALSKTDLRKLYPEPKELVRNAHAPGLDETCQRFIKATSLLLLSSTNSGGYLDITPRGGPPGFVTVLDDKNIAFLNEMGNNKILTLSNLSENKQVGLMFIVPGQVEIVRAYGNAIASSDEDFILSLGGNLKRNKTAIQIEIIKVFPHCSTAINRAGLWKQEEWPDKEAFNIPGIMEMAEGLATYRLQLKSNSQGN